jgi:hypothetical protein
VRLKHLVTTTCVAACATVFLLPESSAQGGSEAKKGSWERIKVHGKSLEGNLEGDSPDRDVFVYLPPSYATSPEPALSGALLPSRLLGEGGIG